MPLNDLGFALPTNLLRWTKASKDCYFNGLNCRFCPIADDLKTQCRMKPVVIELVKKFGAPHKEEEEWEEQRS